MIELELNQADKDRISDDIKLTMILGLLFTIMLLVVIFVIPFVLFLLDITADGFARRGLFIMGLLSLPLIGISWKNFIKYIDLLRRRKISFRTSDYEIKKNGFVLWTRTPVRLKFDLYEKLPDLIKLEEPVTIETTKSSKTLLFISQDSENLLEKLEREDN